QVGLIDYQDAMIGPTAYDLASIVQDARVTISPELQARLLSHYL
ncbi:phosphotransferase, partial [Rhizobium sp. BR5]